MRARAAVEVGRRDGRTVVSSLRSDPPLTLRRTAGGSEGAAKREGSHDAARVHLVSSAAGPLGGDDLSLALTVHENAALHLRGLGAMLALPGAARDSGPPARLATHVTAAAGADLDVRMPPVILADGCRLHTTTTIRLARDATLLWAETTALGRHGEVGGGAIFDLDVRRDDGSPVVTSSLDLSDPVPRHSPAVLAEARAIGQVLLVAPGLRRPPGTAAALSDGACHSAIHELDDALLITVLGPDLRLVDGLLTRALLILRDQTPLRWCVNS